MPDDFWKQPLRIEKGYFNSINLFTRYLKKALRTKSNLDEVLGRITGFTESPEWEEYAHAEASKMVERVAVKNAGSWREAARRSTKGKQIYEGLKADLDNNKAFHSLISSNASLIKNLPRDIAQKMTDYAATQAIAGKRFDVIYEEIRKHAPELSESRARLIARTETAKAQAAITQVRAQRVGHDWYIWRGSLDQRERKSHKALEGVACRFSSPPAPESLIGIKSTLGHYNAGDCPNCRCFAGVVVEVSFEKYPLKVCTGDKIITVNEQQFKAMQ